MARSFPVFIVLCLCLCLAACGSEPGNIPPAVATGTATPVATNTSDVPTPRPATAILTINTLAGKAVSLDSNWAQVYPANQKDNPKLSTPQFFVTPDFNSTSLSNLNDIDCPTIAVCYITSANGKIFATFDSGQSWKTLFAGTESLESLSCPSESFCTVISARGLVLTTSDSGRDWQQQHLTLPAYSSFSVIKCSGLKNCFIGGSIGILFISQDGGETWIQYDTGTAGYFNSFSCPTELDCLAVGSGVGAMLTVPPGAEKKPELVSIATSDGGKTWSVNQNYGFGMQSLTCPALSLCFSVENRISDVYMAPYHIYSSRDRGKSWGTIQIAESKFELYDFIVCPSVQNCYAKSSTGFLVVTTDGGNTWDWSNSGPGFNAIKMSCPAAKKCYAIGNADGGKNYGNLILTTTSQFPLTKAFPAPTPTPTPRIK